MPRRRALRLSPNRNTPWTKPRRFLLKRKKSRKMITRMKAIPMQTRRISTMKAAIPIRAMSSARASHRLVPISNYPPAMPIKRKVSIPHQPLGYPSFLPLCGENYSQNLVFLSVSLFFDLVVPDNWLLLFQVLSVVSSLVCYLPFFWSCLLSIECARKTKAPMR